jgi:hypothetical protein
MAEPTLADALALLNQATNIISAMVARADAADRPPQPPRVLRFTRTDRSFDNLTNIACYAFMKKDEERRATGSRKRDRVIPYGVPFTPTVGFKIENYRNKKTGRGTFGGKKDGSGFTKTIRFLCDFDPTYAELDEAAAWYTAHPE